MDRATAAALVAAVAAERRQRRQRRRAWLMSGFTVLTLAAMTVIGRMVVVLDRMPGTPASLSADIAVSPVPAPRVVDRAAGLSYVLLGAPWGKGCPDALSAGGFRWTDGESTVAGIVSGGRIWYANACSGVLPRALWGSSPSQAASRVMDSVYSAGLPSTRSMLSDKATRIAGKPAWMVLYLVRYPGQHLGWTSSLGAVVVVGRSVFYVSVPSSLGSGNALTVLNSLS
jgi:hypothetical protein